MKKEKRQNNLHNLPACAAEFIKLVIKKMRYRRKVRAEVMAELAAHFEDELKDCKTDTEKEQKARQLITEFGDVKLLAVLMRRAKKRCRPLWRIVAARTFQTAGVLILCLIVYCIYISLGKPTININYIEEATRIARTEADESQNAAPLYQRAIEVFNKPPVVEQEEGIEKKNLLDVIGAKYWIDELTEKEVSLLKQWISDNSEAINLFKQATEKPHCWWHRQAKGNLVLSVLMPELKDTRGFAKLLCWRAKLQAFNGDTEQAFDDILACYRAGRHFKGPRSLIEQLVGIAMQAMSAQTAIIILHNQQVESDLLKNFQANIEKLMAEDTFIADYKVERFCTLDFIQRCYTDNGRGSGHMIPSSIGEFQGLFGDSDNPALNYSQCLAISLVSANRGNMSREFEKSYDTAQKWAYKTPWQLREENVDWEIGIDKWSRLKQIRYWPATLLLPAVGRVSEISYRNKTEIEALITIVALLRYHQDNGQYPQNLDKLVAGNYLKQLPIDPFSNESLIYKKTDDGFILYSVGLNFTDDGGKLGKDSEGRIKRWADNGDNVFWPLPK